MADEMDHFPVSRSATRGLGPRLALNSLLSTLASSPSLSRPRPRPLGPYLLYPVLGRTARPVSVFRQTRMRASAGASVLACVRVLCCVVLCCVCMLCVCCVCVCVCVCVVCCVLCCVVGCCVVLVAVSPMVSQPAAAISLPVFHSPLRLLCKRPLYHTSSLLWLI